MREPRPRQRLPEGGLEILERRKAGTWKKPDLLAGYPADWKSPYGKTPKRQEILSWGYTLIIQPHFDPLLYFWPVDEWHFVAHVSDINSDHTKRLVRATLRDGAVHVAIAQQSKLSAHHQFFTQESGHKKPSAEWVIEYSELDIQRKVFA